MHSCALFVCAAVRLGGECSLQGWQNTVCVFRCWPLHAAGMSATQESPVVSCTSGCLLVSREVDDRCIRVRCVCVLQ